jgi:flotillin
VWPAWEQHEILSLRMMTLEIDLRHVYTVQGIPINVKAVAQVKVRGTSTTSARRRGLSRHAGGPIQATIKETVAGHLRGIVGTLTVEELYRDQRRFQEKVREEAHVDLEGMGFEFKSFVFQAIQDDQGYLNALGQPKIQEALKNARIATANMPTATPRSRRSRRGSRRSRSGSASTPRSPRPTRRSASRRPRSRRRSTSPTRRRSRPARWRSRSRTSRSPNRRSSARSSSSTPTIREQADAKKYEAERLADAKKYSVEQEAAAERMRREQAAMAVKAEGIAKAEAESAQRRQIGLAEAEAILAKGEAEAEARRKLAEALKLYNEAGLSIEALKVLPEIAAAVAEPLSRAGETTIISNGGRPGDGTGAARLTDDVIQVLSQLGPIMKQLAGVDLEKLLRDVSSLPGAVAARLDGTKDPGTGTSEKVVGE